MKIDHYHTRYLLLVLCFWPCLAASATELGIFQLINERLNYMTDVALYKKQNNLPVEDLAREQIVIANAVAAAASQGLQGESIELFFATQIGVAKAIQFRSLANWISEPATGTAPDLLTEIRPALSRLGDEIVMKLAEFIAAGNLISEVQRASFHREITAENLSLADNDRLFNSLLLVRATQE
ncbi:MAG: gamma subclass chorismate mutase AroQ [Gammaproteobacteria bacterium]|nr:gamma subclass chorismate mutase AroQ [Gammaproteobacteria bacterium]